MGMVPLTPRLNHPAPTVSVCIANYNGEALLPECINSVLAQDCSVSVEIIVHDDASTDRSVALMLEQFPQVELLVSEKNVGFCIANNRMVAHARGDYVLLLNNDAVLYVDALSVLLCGIAENRDGGVLSLPQYNYQTGQLIDLGAFLDLFHTPVPNTDPKCTDVAYVIGACLFLPRSLWVRLGGFPEWFESIAEDMYLCCAARIQGIPVRCLPVSGYRHRQGVSFGGSKVTASGLESRYRRRYLSERNRIGVLVSCTPGPAFWPWLALHVAALLLEGLLLSTLLLSSRPWRAIYAPALRDAWRMRQELLELRHLVQFPRRSGLVNYLRVFVLLPRKLVLLFRHGTPRLQD